MNTGLLHRLAFGIWAMDPARATAYYGLVAALLKGEAPPATTKRTIESKVVAKPTGAGATAGNSGNVLVIGISDVLMKQGGECSYGMEDVAALVQTAEQDPSILGGVLKLDSPGGEGNAMFLLAGVLAETKKPWVAYVDHGIAASAAYGIAASCREVYLSSPQCIVGSVGAVITLVDVAAKLRTQGVPVHEVFATLSTDKNGPFNEAMKAPGDGTDSEHYTRLRTELLDPFNNAFIAMVKKQRPQMEASADQWQKGSTFFGDEAINIGMADGYATLATVVARVRELATTSPANPGEGRGGAPQFMNNTRQLKTGTSTTTTSTMKFSTIWAAALAAIGISEEKPTPTAEDVTKFNASVKETGYQLAENAQLEKLGTIAELQAKANIVDELRTKLTGETAKVQATQDTLRAALEKHNVKLAEGEDPLTKAITTLEAWAAKPGATHTGAPKAGDDKPEKKELTASQKVAQEAGISMG